MFSFNYRDILSDLLQLLSLIFFSILILFFLPKKYWVLLSTIITDVDMQHKSISEAPYIFIYTIGKKTVYF